MSAGKRRILYGVLTAVSLILAVGFWLLTVRFSRAFIPEAIVSTLLTPAFGYRFFRLRCANPSGN